MAGSAVAGTDSSRSHDQVAPEADPGRGRGAGHRRSVSSDPSRADWARAARWGGGASSGGFGAERKNRTPPAKTYVLDGPARMHPVTVRAGLTDGSFTEILDGELKEGQEVVTSVAGGSAGSRSTTSAPPGFGGPGGMGGGGGRGR